MERTGISKVAAVSLAGQQGLSLASRERDRGARAGSGGGNAVGVADAQQAAPCAAPWPSLRNLAISVFRQDGETNIAAALRRAGHACGRPLRALGLTPAKPDTS